MKKNNIFIIIVIALCACEKSNVYNDKDNYLLEDTKWGATYELNNDTIDYILYFKNDNEATIQASRIVPYHMKYYYSEPDLIIIYGGENYYGKTDGNQLVLYNTPHINNFYGFPVGVTFYKEKQ